jgi:hypothetical protein
MSLGRRSYGAKAIIDFRNSNMHKLQLKAIAECLVAFSFDSLVLLSYTTLNPNNSAYD